METVIALLTWLSCRGGTNGPLFCGYSLTTAGVCFNPSTALSDQLFTNFMRDIFSSIGIGEGDVQMYTGHSIKRGSVQIYRSPGLRG